MADDDEDDDAQALDSEQDRDDREDAGSEGDGAEREDSRGRDEAGDLPTERADAETDEGAPQKGRPTVDEAQSRRTRYQRLANENREYKDRLDRLEREREQERQLWNQRQTQLNEQQERERLNLMTPEERGEYLRQQDRRQMTEQLRQFQMQTAMQLDRSSYDAKAVNNPVYRRMQEQVEQKFAEQMRIGQPTDRETILKFLLGEQALNGAATAPAQRRAARRRVEAERVAPAATRSSTSVQGRKVSTAEERLKDVII